MLTDPIADYLTRIRNAIGAGHDEVEIPASRPEDGDVADPQGAGLHHATSTRKPATVGEAIKIRLKYTEDRRPVILGIERVSRPGRRRYVDHKQGAARRTAGPGPRSSAPRSA